MKNGFISLPEGSAKQTTIPAEATSPIYTETEHWITSNPDLPDAQALARLIMFLSASDWSYAVAVECTKHMNESSLARALLVLQQFFYMGRCQELQRLATVLRSRFPNLSVPLATPSTL